MSCVADRPARSGAAFTARHQPTEPNGRKPPRACCRSLPRLKWARFRVHRRSHYTYSSAPPCTRRQSLPGQSDVRLCARRRPLSSKVTTCAPPLPQPADKGRLRERRCWSSPPHRCQSSLGTRPRLCEVHCRCLRVVRHRPHQRLRAVSVAAGAFESGRRSRRGRPWHLYAMTTGPLPQSPRPRTITFATPHGRDHLCIVRATSAAPTGKARASGSVPREDGAEAATTATFINGEDETGHGCAPSPPLSSTARTRWGTGACHHRFGLGTSTCVGHHRTPSLSPLLHCAVTITLHPATSCVAVA